MAEKSAGRDFDKEKGLNPTRGDPMEFEQSIKELITRAQAGDKPAENELFAKLHARFSGVVRRNIWNAKKKRLEMEKDIEDVVAGIMDAIFIQLQKGSVLQESFMALANCIARNKMVDYIRQKEQEKKLQPLDMEIPLPNSDQPNGIYAEQELKEFILRALPRLTKKDKEIMRALFTEQIRLYIAERLKSSPRKTIDADIHRCRKRLKKLLAKEGFII